MRKFFPFKISNNSFFRSKTFIAIFNKRLFTKLNSIQKRIFQNIIIRSFNTTGRIGFIILFRIPFTNTSRFPYPALSMNILIFTFIDYYMWLNPQEYLIFIGQPHHSKIRILISIIHQFNKILQRLHHINRIRQSHNQFSCLLNSLQFNFLSIFQISHFQNNRVFPHIVISLHNSIHTDPSVHINLLTISTITNHQNNRIHFVRVQCNDCQRNSLRR